MMDEHLIVVRKRKGSKYPNIYISDTGLIVYMTGGDNKVGTGMVLNGKADVTLHVDGVGHIGCHWCMEHFTLFEGKISFFNG